ncbi:MAG: IPT/TIG domain-containing protein [Treponema sp.]|nr:IPT/TIG domain-containing protein [Treponema sp.]
MVILLGIIVASILFINHRIKPIPEIESIVPPVGSPGDVVIISGKNFGDARNMSYVEFSGSKLTSSSYISWSDTQIKLVLPANIRDGLVVVGTKDSRSKPSLFANEVDIPVPVTTYVQSTKPVITEVSSKKFKVGDLIKISGNNFGESRNKTKVLFTMDYNNKIKESDVKNINLLTENMLEANENEFDYLSWSNTEIELYVPDGISSGIMYIDTGKEKSEALYYTLDDSIGSKTFTNKKIYLMEYTADIADVVTNDTATITLRCPLPEVYSLQPNLEITDVTPSPILYNYQKDLIHQVVRNKSSNNKSFFDQTFVLTVYEVKTNVNVDKVGSYKNINPVVLENALKADSFNPCDNQDILELCLKIVGREKNPYKKAKMIYDYMCDNYRILKNTRKGDANPLDMLKSKKGDAYDFAVIYTSLLRAADIPAYTDSGVLVGQDFVTQVHWWSEFYLEGFGWIPVDTALGAGLEYNKWNEGKIEDSREYYFGNLDSHHITFSRGWNQLKPFSQDNKIVQQPRSFALQSIWEEASNSTVKYSSYWSVPVIKGLY